jgi:hypothetical protein
MTQLDALTTTLTTITFGDGPEPIEQRLAAVADLVAAIARDLQAADPADPDARTHHLDRLPRRPRRPHPPPRPPGIRRVLAPRRSEVAAAPSLLNTPSPAGSPAGLLTDRQTTPAPRGIGRAGGNTRRDRCQDHHQTTNGTSPGIRPPGLAAPNLDQTETGDVAHDERTERFRCCPSTRPTLHGSQLRDADRAHPRQATQGLLLRGMQKADKEAHCGTVTYRYGRDYGQ